MNVKCFQEDTHRLTRHRWITIHFIVADARFQSNEHQGVAGGACGCFSYFLAVVVNRTGTSRARTLAL